MFGCADFGKLIHLCYVFCFQCTNAYESSTNDNITYISQAVHVHVISFSNKHSDMYVYINMFECTCSTCTYTDR